MPPLRPPREQPLIHEPASPVAPSSHRVHPGTERPHPRVAHGSVIQFTLHGLMLYSGALILAAGFLTWALLRSTPGPATASVPAATPPVSEDAIPATPPAVIPLWGELNERSFQLERPAEYAAFDIGQSKDLSWTFAGMSTPQVRALMQECGVPAALIEHALSTGLATENEGKVIINPDEQLILGLTPTVREKLYGKLAAFDENFYMGSPFTYGKKEFKESVLPSLDEPARDLVAKLAYERGHRVFLSDVGFVLAHMPDDAARLKTVKTISLISAVRVRLVIRPDTDIDKLIGYWNVGPGFRETDVRPMLESLQRQKGGGTIGLAYLLPQFVRERLYRFPLNSKAGEADADCHWSTMNFFNTTPDDRFLDLQYTSDYIAANCYQIATPTHHGDVLFVLDAQGRAIHSAVYLADDLVFTKNGKSFGQPWLIMHLPDVIAMYSAGHEARVVYYRNKTL
ncbi:MAG: hypothetical protein QM796_22085 [Chthoniobacteraceae bacterium]